jgi:hypothetical protein
MPLGMSHPKTLDFKHAQNGFEELYYACRLVLYMCWDLQLDVRSFCMHAYAWAWIQADVRVGVRLIQRSTIVKASVYRVARLIYSAATTVRWALFLLCKLQRHSTVCTIILIHP